jgi:uridylate kinase
MAKRPEHIETALVALHGGQWFGWTDSKNKIYANLILHSKCYVDGVYKDNPHSKPTEVQVNDKLKELQDDWDSKNA